MYSYGVPLTTCKGYGGAICCTTKCMNEWRLIGETARSSDEASFDSLFGEYPKP